MNEAGFVLYLVVHWVWADWNRVEFALWMFSWRIVTLLNVNLKAFSLRSYLFIWARHFNETDSVRLNSSHEKFCDKVVDVMKRSQTRKYREWLSCIVSVILNSWLLMMRRSVMALEWECWHVQIVVNLRRCKSTISFFCHLLALSLVVKRYFIQDQVFPAHLL